jgi:hypothetical protein
MVESSEELMGHAEQLTIGGGTRKSAEIIADLSLDQHVINLVRISSKTTKGAGFEGMA